MPGSIMGTTIAPAASYTAKVKIEDPDSTVSTIEIVTNGGATVTSGSANSGTVDWSSEISATDGGYYYARITTSDGAKAWTAPVWVSSSAP